MTGSQFMTYLQDEVRKRHAAFIPGGDPEVEFYDGRVRIHDQRGESCTLPTHVVPRQLRQLSTMLALVADEMERRRFER